jgi:prolipoprotein diacylglyceryltransferase
MTAVTVTSQNMPAAFIPSPARGLWHIGPIPVRGYALCVVLGIIVCLWVADRRYLKIGGRPGFILDLATLAVPLGLAGARVYGVITSYHLYFGPGRDWADVFRIWEGGFGLPGGVAGAAAGAWIACRRAGVRLGPVAGAAAPGLAFAAAVARWADWFSQESYGRPATVPWALEISPQRRVAGFENFATFQPTFLYESVWDVLAGLMVILAARRFLLTGDRTFAVYAALQAIGTLCTQELQIGYSERLFGLRSSQVAMIVVLAGAVGYLYLTRSRKGPDILGAAGGLGVAPSDAAGSGDGPAAGRRVAADGDAFMISKDLGR